MYAKCSITNAGDKVFETATQLRIVQALKSDLGVSEFGSENVANSVDDKKASAELPVGYYKGLSWDIVVGG